MGVRRRFAVVCLSGYSVTTGYCVRIYCVVEGMRGVPQSGAAFHQKSVGKSPALARPSGLASSHFSRLKHGKYICTV